MTRLAGKCAIVTGAASGIGRAAAQALVASGAEIIGLDLKIVPGSFDIRTIRAFRTSSESLVLRLPVVNACVTKPRAICPDDRPVPPEHFANCDAASLDACGSPFSILSAT